MDERTRKATAMRLRGYTYADIAQTLQMTEDDVIEIIREAITELTKD